MSVAAVAIVVERNKLVGRRIARVLGCAGYEARIIENPDAFDAVADVPDGALVVADAFDVEAVVGKSLAKPNVQALLYCGEPVDRLIARALEAPRLVALLGRASFDAPPRESDLLLAALAARGQLPAPPAGGWLHLAPGAATLAWSIDGPGHRDAVVGEAVSFVARLGAPKRVGEMIGELAHELIMNALYDAPVDAAGKPRYAHDRKVEIQLPPEDAATVRIGSDGVRLAVEVTDRFGGLERRHVFGGLSRGLSSGQLDTAGGGAGLGMLVAYRSTTGLWWDVVPGKRTRVTGLFDLDLNLREFRQLPKTLVFREHA